MLVSNTLISQIISNETIWGIIIYKREAKWKRSYGEDSRTMLLACVEDGDLWFTNTSLGEVWTTWSTRWPTEDGRNRVPSCVNAEFRLYKEEEKLSENVL